MKTLVVYYSFTNGNTKRIAGDVAEYLGADLERIDVEVPYPAVYEEASAQGHKEVDAGYCPVLKQIQFQPETYDLIVLGTPTWWYSMSPAMRTYLSEHDWNGKIVVPFMTNAGWPGTVLADMKSLLKNADVRCEKEILFDHNGGAKMVTDEDEIDHWIESISAVANA